MAATGRPAARVPSRNGGATDNPHATAGDDDSGGRGGRGTRGMYAVLYEHRVCEAKTEGVCRVVSAAVL